jgi:hypothetical protein
LDELLNQLESIDVSDLALDGLIHGDLQPLASGDVTQKLHDRGNGAVQERRQA